jgi:hypothetical protein
MPKTSGKMLQVGRSYVKKPDSREMANNKNSRYQLAITVFEKYANGVVC